MEMGRLLGWVPGDTEVFLHKLSPGYIWDLAACPGNLAPVTGSLISPLF